MKKTDMHPHGLALSPAQGIVLGGSNMWTCHAASENKSHSLEPFAECFPRCVSVRLYSGHAIGQSHLATSTGMFSDWQPASMFIVDITAPTPGVTSVHPPPPPWQVMWPRGLRVTHPISVRIR